MYTVPNQTTNPGSSPTAVVSVVTVSTEPTPTSQSNGAIRAEQQGTNLFGLDLLMWGLGLAGYFMV